MTSLPENEVATLRQLERVRQHLADRFVERDDAIRLLILCAVAREHLLLIGPPGTAKTQVITQFARLVDAKSFQYLLTRFTEPTELFGPIDVGQFHKGVYRISTEGMLPKAEIAFLDEVFQAGSAILNSLLTVLNERLFFNGSEREKVPLISLIGASNQIPDDPWLKAFADRFILRLHLVPVPEQRVDQLLHVGWQTECDRIDKDASSSSSDQMPDESETFVSMSQLASLHEWVAKVDANRIMSDYSELLHDLRAEGIELSDRRAVKGLKLIAAATLLRQSLAPTPQDFWPLMYCWNRPEEAEVVASVIRPRIESAGGIAPNPARSLEDINLELDMLESQADDITTEPALITHLKRLNALKREVVFFHPDEQQTLRRITELIDSAMDRFTDLSNF